MPVKMTEAGKLYLRDYYILTEARKEMDAYLNDVFDRIETFFLQTDDEIKSPYYDWDYWRHKSTGGYLEFYVIPREDIKCLRKGKQDIFIIVSDVRGTNLLEHPHAVSVRLTARRSNKPLIQELIQIHHEFKKSETLKEEVIDLSLEDAGVDTENIMRVVHSSIRMINDALTQLKG